MIIVCVDRFIFRAVKFKLTFRGNEEQQRRQMPHTRTPQNIKWNKLEKKYDRNVSALASKSNIFWIFELKRI